MLQRSRHSGFMSCRGMAGEGIYLSQIVELLLHSLLPSTVTLTKYVLADRGQRHGLVCEEIELDILPLKKTPG